MTNYESKRRYELLQQACSEQFNFKDKHARNSEKIRTEVAVQFIRDRNIFKQELIRLVL